ncbi:MAG: peptidoglycan-binding protein [Lachnospiraceae bacterium]|nr:peptidoglycan-binding protein [Lachnospiraceae bacterium]MDD7077553.1 peptidoglycan-binding protein [Lachnospiraceae bacterium]
MNLLAQAKIRAAQNNMVDTGTLQITAVSQQNIPIENASVQISYTGDPDNVIEEIQTDGNGQSEILTLNTPPIEYSLQPSEIMPYAEYTIRVTASGFEPIVISGIEVLSTQLSLQQVRMRPQEIGEQPDTIAIPDHTLYGIYPPKIAEAEIKPVNISGEIVLDQVVVPEYVVVHDGPPRDTSAGNYYVRYKDYIKNVASSEIYATWPYETLIANILAIQSFTMNRIYTEWYRNKGFNFTITSSTAYDQKWIRGRNIFESIDEAVEDVFLHYLSRPNVRQPILTQYCDGQRVQCPQWLSQWGSAALGEQGYEAIEIIRNYYGDSMYINMAEEVSGIPESYPGFPLSIGSVGSDVIKIQEQLNAISDNYPLIPKLTPDGVFGEQTQDAVRTFQSIFGLTQDGVVGPRTWYRIQDIYVAVTRLAENV